MNYSNLTKKNNVHKLKYLFFAFLFISLTAPAIRALAQANVLETSLASMAASSDPLVVSEGNKIKNLVFDLQPGVYLNKGIIDTYGSGTPVNATSDAQSVAKLYYANTLYSQIELITIKLDSPSDLNFNIDLANLTSFGKLKYLVFIYTFNVSPSAINTLYTQNGTGVSIFYSISLDR